MLSQAFGRLHGPGCGDQLDLDGRNGPDRGTCRRHPAGQVAHLLFLLVCFHHRSIGTLPSEQCRFKGDGPNPKTFCWPAQPLPSLGFLLVSSM